MQVLDEEREILKEQIEKGNKAKKAWDLYIKDFVQEQKELSFEAFCACDVMDTEMLKETKRTMTNILALESKIEEDIQSGEMSQNTLNQVNQRTKNEDG